MKGSRTIAVAVCAALHLGACAATADDARIDDELPGTAEKPPRSTRSSCRCTGIPLAG